MFKKTKEETVAPEKVEKAPEKKAEKAVKAAVKKAEKAEKAAEKKAEKVEKAAAKAEKAAAKAEKAPAKQEEIVYIQFSGAEWDVAELKKKAMDAYVAEGHRASTVKKFVLYVKPEERMAYYVINEKSVGSVSFE